MVAQRMCLKHRRRRPIIDLIQMGCPPCKYICHAASPCKPQSRTSAMMPFTRKPLPGIPHNWKSWNEPPQLRNKKAKPVLSSSKLTSEIIATHSAVSDSRRITLLSKRWKRVHVTFLKAVLSKRWKRNVLGAVYLGKRLRRKTQLSIFRKDLSS